MGLAMSNYNLPLVRAPRVQGQSQQILTDGHIVLVCPPKCAQTSLRQWLGQAEPLSPRAAEEAGYPIVMAVRNPYARLVSAYRNKFSKMRFRAFVNKVTSTHDLACDIHVQSQTWLLPEGRYPDYMIRVEHLAQDVERFALGTRYQERELKHANASSGGHYLKQYEGFSQEDMDVVRARYRDDFALWNYANAEYSIFQTDSVGPVI